jgi:hypothetical protein
MYSLRTALATRAFNQRKLKAEGACVRVCCSRHNFGVGEWKFMTSVLSQKARQGNVNSRLKRAYLQAPPCTKCVFWPPFNLSNIKSHSRKEECGVENGKRIRKRTERRKD